MAAQFQRHQRIEPQIGKTGRRVRQFGHPQHTANPLLQIGTQLILAPTKRQRGQRLHKGCLGLGSGCRSGSANGRGGGRHKVGKEALRRDTNASKLCPIDGGHRQLALFPLRQQVR